MLFISLPTANFLVKHLPDAQIVSEVGFINETGDSFVPGGGFEKSMKHGEQLIKNGIFDFKYYLVDDGTDIMKYVSDYRNVRGERYVGDTGNCINKKTGIIGNVFDTGIYETGYNYDTKQECFFAVPKTWQHENGYGTIYDIVAFCTGYYFDIQKMIFDYGDRTYMIECWKGHYAPSFTGTEIGIYFKDKDSSEKIYDCLPLDELMPMSITLSDKNGKLIFDRAEEEHWWMTGFVKGAKLINPFRLRMTGSIAFPCEEMAEKCCAAAAEACKRLTAERDGCTVRFSW